MKYDVAVVGAGMSGLVAAHRMTQAGQRVVVLDKGRGPGSRMSSRRQQDHVFDHGAQYFTARDETFCQWVRDWQRQGLVAPWEVRLGVARHGTLSAKHSEEPRYVGVPRMRAIIEALTRNLNVQFEQRITQLNRIEGGYRLVSQASFDIEASWVVISIPSAQALPLLRAPAPALAAQVSPVVMHPCWAVMIACAEPLDVPFDGLFVHDNAVSWAARDSSKPGRPPGQRWVLHANPEWSTVHLETEPQHVIQMLLEAFQHAVGQPLPDIEFAAAHRWRYALPAQPLEDGMLIDPEARIIVTGDWCAGTRVEGAFTSGLSASEALCAHLALNP